VSDVLKPGATDWRPRDGGWLENRNGIVLAVDYGAGDHGAWVIARVLAADGFEVIASGEGDPPAEWGDWRKHTGGVEALIAGVKAEREAHEAFARAVSAPTEPSKPWIAPRKEQWRRNSWAHRRRR
jgi:hypothetical protein